MQDYVTVVGGGLAGSEAAWQIAERDIKVRLYEMRPVNNTPAHHTDKLGELVCSNSLRSNQLENAVGLLKEEMRRLGSLIMACEITMPFLPEVLWLLTERGFPRNNRLHNKSS